MNDRDIIALAIAGATPGVNTDAACLVGLALEKARHEAGNLRMVFDGDNQNYVLVAALEARIEALSHFISEHMDVAFKPLAAAPVLSIVQGSAES